MHMHEHARTDLLCGGYPLLLNGLFALGFVRSLFVLELHRSLGCVMSKTKKGSLDFCALVCSNS